MSSLHAMYGIFYFIIFGFFTPTWGSPAWKKIHSEAGINVYERQSTLGNLPDFQAVGTVKASVFDVIAVLQDVNRRSEWVHRCSVSKEIKRFGEFELLLYHKTDSPWPVSDRDAAIQTRLYELKKDTDFLAHFKGVKSSMIPPKSNAVRLPHIEGYYLLNSITPQKTKVTYFVHLDPGGLIPKWLVKIATRDLPTQTIIGLRKQIKKTRRSKVYSSFHTRWNPSVRPPTAPRKTWVH